MQILLSVAPCENGSKLKFRSDLLMATVRNKNTDSEIKPSLLELVSITRLKPVVGFNKIHAQSNLRRNIKE